MNSAATTEATAPTRHQIEAFRVLRLPCWPRDIDVVLADRANPHRAQLVRMYAEQLARSEARALRTTDLKRAAAGDRADR